MNLLKWYTAVGWAVCLAVGKKDGQSVSRLVQYLLITNICSVGSSAWPEDERASKFR